MKAKKSLGQNFLKSPGVVKKIIDSAKLDQKDVVLEVGPGKGILTEGLLEKAGKVIAVEKDRRLIEILKERFEKEIEAGKLEIIYEDILEFEIEKSGLKKGEYKLVANIPYYITGQLLRKFLSGKTEPALMIVMLQKEVAQRILTRGKKSLNSDQGKESLLSISVKAYGAPKLIQNVPKRYFSPEPKVDSAVLAIENISKDFFRDMDEKRFWKVLKAGFSQKRKKLIRNLEVVKSAEKLKTAFQTCSIEENSRAEDISLDSWKCLVEKLEN